MILLVHILTGGLGLLSGYVALSVAKGAPLHRKSGMLFVCVMLTMSVTGMLISAVEGVAPAINIPSALLTFYLVITSLTTVRPPLLVALARSRRDVDGDRRSAWSASRSRSGRSASGGREAGMAYPLVMFGVVALLASAGDRRMIRAGGFAARLV